MIDVGRGNRQDTDPQACTSQDSVAGVELGEETAAEMEPQSGRAGVRSWKAL